MVSSLFGAVTATPSAAAAAECEVQTTFVHADFVADPDSDTTAGTWSFADGVHGTWRLDSRSEMDDLHIGGHGLEVRYFHRNPDVTLYVTPADPTWNSYTIATLGGSITHGGFRNHYEILSVEFVPALPGTVNDPDDQIDYADGRELADGDTYESGTVLMNNTNDLIRNTTWIISSQPGATALSFTANSAKAYEAVTYSVGRTVTSQTCEEVTDDKADYDQDGIADSIEKVVDPDTGELRDSDADGLADFEDSDSDNDDLSDWYEAQLNGEVGGDPVDSDGDGLPDYIDPDSDDDGIADSFEAGVDEATGLAVDTDNDGTPDYLDLDSDNDGVPDAVEGWDVQIGYVVDTDGDGVPNFRDLDSDNDGVPDFFEAQMNEDSGRPLDTDGDQVPDYLDIDSDDDGVPDAVEASIDPESNSLTDTDGDGAADHLDLDADNDGILDRIEDPQGIGLDIDGEGIPNTIDSDSDGDGIPDGVEDPLGTGLDSDGDGLPDATDTDSDGDGLSDAVETVLDPVTGTPLDSDHDGLPNQLDADSDGDGISDGEESTGDRNHDGVPDYLEPAPLQAEDDAASTGTRSPLHVAVLNNDDFDLDASTVKLIHPDTGVEYLGIFVEDEGTWIVNEDGTVTFTPLPDFTGEATPVSYVAELSDGSRRVSAEIRVTYDQSLTTPVVKSATMNAPSIRAPASPAAAGTALTASPAGATPASPVATKPASLAFTGSSSRRMLFPGLAMIFSGGSLLRLTRRNSVEPELH